MRGSKPTRYLLAAAVSAVTVCFLLLVGSGPKLASAADAGNDNVAAVQPAADSLPSEICLGCHGDKGFAAPGPDGKMRTLYVNQDKFGNSVHGKRQCIECHKDITDIPHKQGAGQKVSCVTCHESLWKAAEKEGKTKD